MNFFIIPKVQNAFHTIYRDILQKKAAIKFDDRTFVQIDNYRIYVNKVDKRKDELIGVNIYKFTRKLTTRIVAQKGQAKHVKGKGLVFTLRDGILQNTPHDKLAKLTQFAFRIYRIVIPLETKSQITKTKSLREFTVKELLNEIETYKKKKLPTTYLETEYYLRWVLGSVVFFFCILAIPLGTTLQRSSKSIGTGITLVVITIYYFLLIGSIVLSEKGTVPAKYIMWSSNIIIFIPGLLLNIRMLKK